jgi:hypothetical protein
VAIAVCALAKAVVGDEATGAIMLGARCVAVVIRAVPSEPCRWHSGRHDRVPLPVMLVMCI